MTPQGAYRAVRSALDAGILSRPERCEECGHKPRRGSDGRATIHAHHENYNEPLSVRWLCAKCHRHITPFPKTMGAPAYGKRNGAYLNPPKGSKNGAALLDEARVSRIKSMRDVPVKLVARQFGVAPSTIYDIRSGRRWPHVAAAPKVGE